MESRTSIIENKIHVGYENWKKIDNCTFDDSCKPKGVCHSNRTKIQCNMNRNNTNLMKQIRKMRECKKAYKVWLKL